MRNIYTINGIKTIVQKADLDKNNKTGGIEKTQQKQSRITPVREETELGAVMEKVFPVKDQSKIIKMLGNIKQEEEQGLFKLSAFTRLNFLPERLRVLIEEYLGLSISRDARGRDDARDISIGKREFDQRSTKDKMTNFVGLGK